MGFLFLILYPGLRLLRRLLPPVTYHNFTHTNLTYNTFTHTNLNTITSRTLTHTHNFVTYHLSHTIPSHTQTSHTITSHTLTHTQLCHIPSLTYNNFTHTNFTYHNFTHTHTHTLTYNNFTHTPLTSLTLTHTHHTHTHSHIQSTWHTVTSTFVLRGRRGTDGTEWRAWSWFSRP